MKDHNSHNHKSGFVKQNILIFSNQGLSVPHLGIELEQLTELSENANIELYTLTCNAVLSSCYSNPCHNLLVCAICESRTRIFQSQIGIKKSQQFRLISFKEECEKFSVPSPISLESIKCLEYKGYNIGKGVASSFISLTRKFTFFETDIPLIKILINSSLTSLLNIKYFAEKIQPTEIHVFNGRFAECHPVLQYCKAKGIPFKTYEVGSNYSKYDIFDNSLPHSISARDQKMMNLWNSDSLSPEYKARVAQNWFKSNRNGNESVGIYHAKNQSKNKLPESFDIKNTNIAIFNTSEDEMKVIDEWQHDYYSSQVDAIEKILNKFKNSHYKFYLRLHPNMQGLDDSEKKSWEKLNNIPNIYIIPPLDAVDTYELIESVDAVITFGSTVGIEATYWGNVSIMFGCSFYKSLNCTYNPNSLEELFILLENIKHLTPIKKNKTYPYAFYSSTRGTDFKHFSWGGKKNSFFKNKLIKRVYFSTLIRFLTYIKYLTKWNRANKAIRKRSLNFQDIFDLRIKKSVPDFEKFNN